MLKRIITGICLIAVSLPILIFSDTWVFPCAIAFVSVVCVFEMIRCMGMHKKIAMTLPLYLFSLIFPFLLRGFKNNAFFVAAIAVMAIIFYIAYIFVWVIFSKGKVKYNDACTLCLTVFYIIFALNLIIYIRDYNRFMSGAYLYILIFIGAWVTDTFAYFTGVFFGKHKLVPDVSPKKTVEGAIGGTVFCAIGFAVFGLVVSLIDKTASPNYLYLIVSGLLIAIISQAGDLIMSVIKRHYSIKDYGNILPGHGGLLDRLDSMLAVSLGVEGIIIFTYLTHIPLF